MSHPSLCQVDHLVHDAELLHRSDVEPRTFYEDVYWTSFIDTLSEAEIQFYSLYGQPVPSFLPHGCAHHGCSAPHPWYSSVQPPQIPPDRVMLHKSYSLTGSLGDVAASMPAFDPQPSSASYTQMSQSSESHATYSNAYLSSHIIDHPDQSAYMSSQSLTGQFSALGVPYVADSPAHMDPDMDAPMDHLPYSQPDHHATPPFFPSAPQVKSEPVMSFSGASQHHGLQPLSSSAPGFSSDEPEQGGLAMLEHPPSEFRTPGQAPTPPRQRRTHSPSPRNSTNHSHTRVSPGAQPNQPGPKARSLDKKPALACLFCRGRKIACGPPPNGSKDKTCNQCARRHLKCEYPLESRRGMRKRRSLVPRGSTTPSPLSPTSPVSASGSRRGGSPDGKILYKGRRRSMEKRA